MVLSPYQSGERDHAEKMTQVDRWDGHRSERRYVVRCRIHWCSVPRQERSVASGDREVEERSTCVRGDELKL